MRPYYLLSILGFCCWQLSAQTGMPGYHPANTIFFEEMTGIFSETPNNLPFIPVRDYTASSLSYKKTDGLFKLGAEPEAIKTFGVSTEGIYRDSLGLLFFGDFSIEKTYYDRLRWNLSYTLPDEGIMPDPHYFGVSKPGDWSNQRYRVTGGILYPVPNKPLTLLARVAYTLENRFRTNLDPRPKITYNDLEFTAGANYEITKGHFVKAHFFYGYTNVDNEITFSNNEQNQIANFDIYVRWVAGYGSLISPFSNNTQRNHTTYGGSIGYAYSTYKNRILIDASIRNREQITFRNNSVEDEDDPANFFGTYEPVEFQVQSTWFHFINDHSLWRAQVEAFYMEGSNFLTSKAGKTYAAERSRIRASFAYLQQNTRGRTEWDMGGDLTYHRLWQRDALAGVLGETQNLGLEAYILKGFTANKNLHIGPLLRVAGNLNLQENFINSNAGFLESVEPDDFPGLALQRYYNEVLIPDMAYLSSDTISAHAGINLDFSTSRNIQIQVALRTGALFPLGDFMDVHTRRLDHSLTLRLFY
ncbi:DUF6850 family outer membrane beta-barrel protein [Ascidiimonas aurantiaca]|uniref:DUF6850 family outer membrane beta-barrel protein n=1 Tax=Ascidiimonas aurantiaca TaxID=1685432 RepID=UPI0030EB615F